MSQSVSIPKLQSPTGGSGEDQGLRPSPQLSVSSLNMEAFTITNLILDVHLRYVDTMPALRVRDPSIGDY